MAKIANIDDLKMELWLRMRNSGKIIWVTQTGDKLALKDMGDSHLVNTIKMLQRNEEQREAEELALQEAMEGYPYDF